MSGQWQHYPPVQGGYSPSQVYQGYPQQPFVPLHGQNPQQYGYGYPPNPGIHQYQGFPQPVLHQPSYQPRRPHQHVAKPTSNTCYNCGVPGHYAQACPEPRREVPVGSIIDRSGQRPAKRFRANYIPPVITKYPVPPHIQAAHGLPQVYGQTPTVQPLPQTGHTPYQPPFNPPTPTSVQSPQFVPQPYWQGPQQNQHPPPSAWRGSEQYARGNYTPQGSPFSTNHGPQPYHVPPTQVTDLHASSYRPHKFHSSSRSISSSSTKCHPVDSAPHLEYSARAGPSSVRSTREHSVSMGTESQNVEDSAQDDYLLLDIPDLPQDAATFGRNKPYLIGIPLPAISESDAARFLPPPFPESHGRLCSKYVNDQNIEVVLRHVRDSQDFDTIKTDPIFLWNTERDALTENLAPSEVKHALSGRSRLDGYPNAALSNGSDHQSLAPVLTKAADHGTNCYSSLDRSNTPVPQQEEDSGAYDPFNPAAGLPTDIISGQLSSRNPYHDQDITPPVPLKQEPARYNVQPTGMTRRESAQVNFNSECVRLNGHYKGDSSTSVVKTHSERKRTRDSYEDDGDEEVRHQHDDFTPKQKRSQPRVAEAYSRRW